MGELGDSLAMDTGTITPLLKRMERCGLVTRTRDPADERRVLINLTPHGDSLRAQVQAVSGQVKSACKTDEVTLALRDTLRDFGHPAKH